MNKRGFFLAEETMKIILAVICLGFLIFVLGKMYYSYATDKETQQAKDTLGRIEKEINSMNEGEPRDIIVYSPASGFVKTWVLISFSGKEKPLFCSEKNWESCLCICEHLKTSYTSIKDRCNEDKVCVYFPAKTLSSQSVDLVNLPITILVKQDKNTISISKK
jgi:hypothetical protein